MSITTYASQACSKYPLPEKVKGEPKRGDFEDELSFEVAKLQYLKCEAAWERQKAVQREKRVQHVEECLKQKKELNEEVKLQSVKRKRGRPPKQVPKVPVATAPKVFTLGVQKAQKMMVNKLTKRNARFGSVQAYRKLLSDNLNVIDVIDDSSSNEESELPELNSSALPESQDYDMLDEIEFSPVPSPRAQSPRAQSLPVQPIRACTNVAKSEQSAPEYDQSFEFWCKVLPPMLSQHVGEFALSNLNDNHLAEIDSPVIFKLANGNLELYCNVSRAIKEYKAALVIEERTNGFAVNNGRTETVPITVTEDASAA